MKSNKNKIHKTPKTLLLIDDEGVWLEAMEQALEAESYKVVTADSGKLALSKLLKVKPDLILSDVRMPDMNGYDLYEKIKAIPKLNKVPFIFMSALDDYDAKRVAKTIGADDYVVKPYDTDEIKRIILDLLVRFKKF
jgi:DNA-binding response OmpR family regulator